MAQTDSRHGHRQRLRERLLTAGDDALADYELLEMILFLSQPRGDVKPLAKELLKRFGSLQGIFQTPLPELQCIKGFGETSAAYFRMIQTISQRLALSDLHKRSILSDIDQLVRYCRLRIIDIKIEQFHVFYLDKKKQFIADEIHQKGTIDHTMVYPRKIMKQALHPWGILPIASSQSSQRRMYSLSTDIDLTHFISEVGLKLGIEVLDHIIVSSQEHCSMKEAKVLI